MIDKQHEPDYALTDRQTDRQTDRHNILLTCV